MKLYPRFFAIFLGVIFVSCDNDEEITYPGPLLKGKSLVKTSDILVYAGGKRVTDQGKIARFLSGDPAWIETESALDHQSETIQFIRADSAVLGGEIGVSVEYYDGKMFLKEPLRIGVWPRSTPFPVVKQILKYQAESEDLPLPGGLGSHYMYYPLYVGYGSPNHFRFFVINYKVSCYREFASLTQTEIAFNEFNTAAIEMLTETDTLAVQTFELVFSR